MNYCDGFWVKHPVQNNSYALPVEERIKVINSFFTRNNNSKITNYEEWLYFQFGGYFSEKYPMRYTRKYWCLESKELSINWIKNRIYQPSTDEVIYGALTKETSNAYYAEEMRYPKKGGYRAFIDPIANIMDIRLSHEAIEINTEKKLVKFRNSVVVKYEKLISSLPLPEIIKIMNNVPYNVLEASKKLIATSIALVSIGFNSIIDFPSLWFYVYDEDIPFARAYSPSLKSKENAPNGKSSIQFEIYYTKNNLLNENNNDLLEKVLLSMERLGIASKEDVEVIDIRYVKYGNVIFYQGMEVDRKIVLDYLNEMKIISIGRFGEWDYLWSNQSFMSGYNAVD